MSMSPLYAQVVLIINIAAARRNRGEYACDSREPLGNFYRVSQMFGMKRKLDVKTFQSCLGNGSAYSYICAYIIFFCSNKEIMRERSKLKCNFKC